MNRQAHALTSTARRWRTALLVACAISIFVQLNGAVQCTPLAPWCATSLGFNEYPVSDGFVVTNVDRNGPAELAGFRTGDAIRFSDIAFLERWRLRDVLLGYGGPAGQKLTYVLHRQDARFVRTIAARRVQATWPTWSDSIATAAAVLALLCAALLAARRPDAIEARALVLILIFIIGANGFTGTFAPSAVPELAFHAFGDLTFLSVPIVCLTIFSATIARPRSAFRLVLQRIAYAAAAAVSASYLAIFVFGYILALPVLWLYTHVAYIVAPGLLASFGCAISAATVATGSERRRTLWVCVALAPLWLFYMLAFFAISMPLSVRVFALDAAFVSTGALATYAILSRRCLDLGYIMNRAVAFTIVSLLVLAAFIVLEWALGSWFNAMNRSANIAFGLVLALVLGLSLRIVHRRVESSVDRILFKKRHEDETALRGFARDAPFITSLDVLLTRTSQVVEEHAEAESAFVLLPDRIDLNENDPAVLAMRASHEPLHLHEYETMFNGEAAFPMTARGRLLGILICGPKTTGEAYAPDEWESLKAVADAVAHALDGLLREDNNLQVQILAELRAISQKLTTLLGREDRTPI